MDTGLCICERRQCVLFATETAASGVQTVGKLWRHKLKLKGKLIASIRTSFSNETVNTDQA
jgi:hypothetical protein